MEIPRIAISGKMKAGKSTLARALSEQLGIAVLPLAYPIKIAAGVLGDPDPFGDGKLRWLQQGIGQFCTNHDTNWFVDLWFRNFERYELPQLLGVVVDDVRRVPEYERFRDEGFLMVRLDISREEQIRRGAPDDDTLDHPTETGLDHLTRHDWDLFFYEGSSLDFRVEVIREELEERGVDLNARAAVPAS